MLKYHVGPKTCLYIIVPKSPSSPEMLLRFPGTTSVAFPSFCQSVASRLPRSSLCLLSFRDEANGVEGVQPRNGLGVTNGGDPESRVGAVAEESLLARSSSCGSIWRR